jgi:AraC-like DNA-binding protein
MPAHAPPPEPRPTVPVPPPAGGAGALLFRQLTASREFAEFALILKRLTGLSMALNTPDVSTSHIGVPRDPGNRLCRMIRATDEGARRCGACDRRHHAAAARAGQPVLYTCHAGFYDFAVPVIVQGLHVATISSGQVLHDPPSEAGFRHLCRRLDWLPVPAAKLRRAYDTAPWLPRKDLTHVMRLLEIFAGHLCDSAWRLHELEAQLERTEIRRAKEWIDAHFREAELQLAEVARQVGLSPAHFSHLFARATGMPLTRYVQCRRVEEAKRLLAERTHSVTDVCFACGFNSLTHFNRVFKAHTGHAPSRYMASRGGA